MFDSIVEALVRELLRSCPPDRQYRLADLKGSQLPEPVARYAADLLRDAARRELDDRRPGDLRWVEPDANTWSIYDRFSTASVSQALAPPEEWEDLIRTATRTAVEHALEPRSGLVHTAFGDDDGTELDQDEVVERVGRYHVGLPFRAAVVRALKSTASPQLNRNAFVSLVNGVHDALTLDYTRAEWQRDLEILATLLDAAGLRDAFPVEAAAILADQLGAGDAAQTLRSSDVDTLTLDAFTDLVAGPEPEEPEEEAAEVAYEYESIGSPKEPAPVPLWQRFQRNLNEPITSPPLAASATPPRISTADRSHEPVRDEASANDPIDLNSEESQRPLWQKYRSSQPPANDEMPATDIEKLILGRDAAHIRDSFVSELFGGDIESYMEVLDRLKDTRDWPEASRVIAENVFKRFQVNIYSEEAVAFTNAVEARFRVQEAGD